jgi:hypothetical protein
MTGLKALSRHLNMWIAVSAVVAVLGYIVAQSTDDDEPPYDERVISTVAWDAFLAGTVIFLVLCVAAGVKEYRRKRLEGRPSDSDYARHP